MPPFSPAQNSRVPMKTRLKMKLAKIMQSELRDEKRVKKRADCVEGCEDVMLKRSASSPTLRSLTTSPNTWSTGRGKGGKKLGVGGGLVKNKEEKGFKEWTKMVKLSNQNLLKKRKEDSLINSSANSKDESPKLKNKNKKVTGG